MHFLTGQGIGDSVWALFKIQDIAKKHNATSIELSVAVSHLDDALQLRALEFLRRFKFLNRVDRYLVKPKKNCAGAVLQDGPAANKFGRYRYLPDGPPNPKLNMWDVHYILLPNMALEHGVRLENWLPEYDMRWDVFRDFEFTAQEQDVARGFADKHGAFAVFYMGSLVANTVAGHNRGSMWRVNDWVRLGNNLHQRYGLKILVVGADYDRSYWEKLVRPALAGADEHWIERIGAWANPCQTFAVLKRASMVISYQSGIGIVSHYLGIPTAIFWRPDGNSVSPHGLVSFSEDMAHAWAYPGWPKGGKFLPCIYGKHDSYYLLSEIEQRNWAKKGDGHASA